MGRRQSGIWWILTGVMLVLVAGTGGCGSPVRRDPVILYDYEGDLPAAVLAAFTQETGIPIEFVAYEGPEEAVAHLRAGKPYDVVVMENRFLPSLISENLLVPIDRRRIRNFKNISLNFRDLVYDPGNHYSVPYTWGTTGMAVRTDLVEEPITRWADLWDPRYAGKVALWRGQPREVISLTLKSLGYSANEESPAALAEVQARLEALRPSVQFIEDTDPISAAPLLVSGSVLISMGYSIDALLSNQQEASVEYILPQEGALLWGDNFVIPAAAPHPQEAAELIDFLLRPEISAEIVQTNYFASANEAALAYIDPALTSDPALYPPQSVMDRTEIVLPLSAEGEALYARVWDAFLAAGD